MVADADAVVDPRAVVVEALNALVADSAMPRSGRSENFAVRTHLAWMDARKHIHELVVWLQVPWVLH